MVQEIIKKYGKIDVLINNAGISENKLFTNVTDEDWNRMINTNLYSAFCVSQEVIPYMIHEKNGCIINISSVWGIVGSSCETIYSIAKAGIDGMTKSLAKELGPSNIRVNSIAPGIIDTEMNKNLTDEDIKNIKEEESKLDWNEIKKRATEELGMQTKIGTPVNLEKTDNVETKTKLIKEEKTSILEKIVEYFVIK